MQGLTIILLVGACASSRLTYLEQEIVSMPLRKEHLSTGSYGHSPSWITKKQSEFKEHSDKLDDEIFEFLALAEAPKFDYNIRRRLVRKFSVHSQDLKYRIDPKHSCTLFEKYFPEYSGAPCTGPFWMYVPKYSSPELIGRIPSDMAEQNVFAHSQFPIPYNNFPNKFNFPKDIFSSYIILKNGKRGISEVNYLFLDLPEAVGVTVDYSRILEMETDSLNYYSSGYKWAPLNFRRILLNPAFVPVYQENIQVIWNLYLFKIKYQIFSDTLYCQGYSPPWAPSCEIDLNSRNVMDYLTTAFDNDPLMYQSYFELILWQMYQPENFTTKDTRGKRRSFTFTSTSEEHPGKYEVKFDIYRPYEFKVRKR